jgi:hypothetical protein
MAEFKRREIDFWRTISQLVRQCFANCGGVFGPMARAGRGKGHSLVLRMLIDHKARPRGIRIKANGGLDAARPKVRQEWPDSVLATAFMDLRAGATPAMVALG